MRYDFYKVKRIYEGLQCNPQGRLIINRSSYLADMLAEADYLTRIAVFVIVPNIKYNAFFIRRDNCSLTVEYAWAWISDNICTYKFITEGVLNLFNQFTFKGIFTDNIFPLPW